MTEQTIEEITIELAIDNRSGKLSKLILEPWADEIDLREGDKVDLRASGPADSARITQVYKGDKLILWASRGWVFAISVNGKEVPTGSSGVPSL